jgi:DNA-binding transcriptional LysR family regulator
MEIKQLEIFIRVVRSRSFSKAAETLYISQPTVSSCISSLEKYLGAQLLIRNTKEVSLTKAGQDFLSYAQSIVSLRDQALRKIGGESKDARGAVDIIASTIPAQHLLPEIIAFFQKQWPNILFRVDQADSRQVEREMSGFRYDFGMIGTVPDDGRFVHSPVYDDELVLVIPNGAPEDLEAIRDGFAEYVMRTPFIMRESGSGTRAEIEAILSKIGVGPRALNIRAHFSDANAILLAVSRGMGVSLIPKIAAKMYVDAGLLRAVEMNSPLFHRQIYLLHNKELRLSPLQEAFADYVRQFYRGGDISKR